MGGQPSRAAAAAVAAVAAAWKISVPTMTRKKGENCRECTTFHKTRLLVIPPTRPRQACGYTGI